jgi:CheY-like chemotaxis protein
MIENEPPGGESWDRPRILYVDDDPNLRYCISAYLARAGYLVYLAENGVHAWESLRSHAFDLLITDHQMPQLTGLELVQRVRLTGMTLPIILTTVDAESLTEPRCCQLRINAALCKPFKPEELSRAVVKALHVSRRTMLPDGTDPPPPADHMQLILRIPIIYTMHSGN